MLGSHLGRSRIRVLQRPGLNKFNKRINDCGPLLTAFPGNNCRCVALVAQETDVDLADVGAFDNLYELARPNGADFDELRGEEDDVVTTV